MNNTYKNNDYITALIQSEEIQIYSFALNLMRQKMNVKWFYFVDMLDLLKQRYEEFESEREMTAHVISLIYYYKNNMD